MKRRPIILVSPSSHHRGAEFEDLSLSVSERYLSAITIAGGLPLVIPRLTCSDSILEAVRACDGVMLTGGDDVQTALYAEKVAPEVQATVSAPDRERDLLELQLIDAAFRARKPLLAICRGHQVLNVALGGTLLTDISLQKTAALNHNRSDLKEALIHEVTLTRDSLLARIMGTRRINVNSSHHQAVGNVAPALRVTGTSADGVIESLELKDSSWLPFLLSVQFHPERLLGKHRQFLKLFKFFVRSCSLSHK